MRLRYDRCNQYSFTGGDASTGRIGYSSLKHIDQDVELQSRRFEFTAKGSLMANRRNAILFMVLGFFLWGYAGTTEAAQLQVIALQVKSIHCEGCAKTIQSKLYTIKGVLKVKTDIQKNLIVIVPASGKTLSARQLWEVLEKANFQPVRLTVPGKVFTKKPSAKDLIPAQKVASKSKSTK